MDDGDKEKKDKARLRTQKYRVKKILCQQIVGNVSQNDSPITSGNFGHSGSHLFSGPERSSNSNSDDDDAVHSGNPRRFFGFKNLANAGRHSDSDHSVNSGNFEIEENTGRNNLGAQNYFEEDDESSELSTDSEDELDRLKIPIFNSPPEYEQLREFGQRISQKDLDILLNILRPNLLPMLPKSAKTFLRTVDARYNIIEMDDSSGKKGQFVYFGLKKGLENCINPELHADRNIELTINADGIPLKRSAFDQFWPITAKVHFEPNIYKVFAVAIYCGQTKPNSVEEYLEKFIEEMNDLQANGITIKGVHLSVKLKCLICDTPARAFLKKTLGHCGKEACERCEVVGEKVERTTVFPSTDAPERTDHSFRTLKQPNHHHGPSPLQKIVPPINMVALFVLDFLHLMCLGTMKKLLEYWLSGNLNVKLRVASRIELGKRLEHLSNQIPLEFQRKTRSTSCLAKWKGTEFRFFLLYCGPIVLKNLLKPELYNHFLLLHVAARILCSESLCHKYNAHAKFYLQSFFTAMKDLYGPTSQVLNSHHLIHISDDVLNMNCNLSRITAFEFESFLGKLKKRLRTPNRPLAQVCRRLHEENVIKSKKTIILPPLFEILATNQGEITKINYKETTISKDSPNNMLLLSNAAIVSVKRMFYDKDDFKLECQVWKKKQPLFTYPTNSEKLNIWNLYTEPSNEITIVSVTSISSKLVKLQLVLTEGGSEELFVVPFLH